MKEIFEILVIYKRTLIIQVALIYLLILCHLHTQLSSGLITAIILESKIYKQINI